MRATGGKAIKVRGKAHRIAMLTSGIVALLIGQKDDDIRLARHDGSPLAWAKTR